MKINIKGCSACGGNHQNLETTKLDGAVRFKNHYWTHLTKCPKTGIEIYYSEAKNDIKPAT